MIPELPDIPLPEWLRSDSEPLGPLPLNELLAGSVYYPASGFDGRPVRYLAGNYHSFIYVDYGVERAEMIRQFTTFRGYSLLILRDLSERDLTPEGWNPLPLRSGDGDPRRVLGRVRTTFAVWAILCRTMDYGPDHGPERFSLLYVAGDGVATFQALYHGNRATPAVVAIIQPGTGWGGNWTNFEDPAQVFARSVRENPAGVPRLLLYGGRGDPKFYRQPCWPEYGEHVKSLTPWLRLWTRPIL